MKKSLLTLFFALLVAMAAVAETTYSKALEEKAILGDADAMLELSTCYRFAMGVNKDIDWANYWLECAAKAGSTKALTVLTSLGDNGTGLKDAKRRELDAIVQREQQKLKVDDGPIDYSTYNDALYRKAQSGDAKAQYYLGDCYYDGKGVAKDYSQVVYWYRKAAEQGYALAQADLGYCYQKGYGVDMDYDKAVYWYRKGADQGNANSQNSLGYCYRNGLGVTADNYQAVYWYRKAAEQGNMYGQNNLGFCYENGYGVTKDINQAIYWYRKAADQGNSSAQDALDRLTSDSSYASDQTFTVGGVSFKMIYVEGGTFSMGATSEQGYDDPWDEEKPVHVVTLSSFHIGETEVTQALWEAVMDYNPSDNKGSKLPVGGVSWNDCQEFVRKLNNMTGKNFRLPYEAEWEFAARGGNKSRGYKYSGSNNIKDVAWCIDNSDKTHKVASKRANELGLYDMSGNVREWCNDYYDENYYSSSPSINPQGPYSGTEGVLRGGCWGHGPRSCRVSSRDGRSLDYHISDIGFRIAL